MQFCKPRENPASSVLDIVYSCLQLEQIAVFRSLSYFKSSVNLSGEHGKHVFKQIKTKNGKKTFLFAKINCITVMIGEKLAHHSNRAQNVMTSKHDEK